MPLHKIDYFCAKLQKNVDSDLLSTLIAIGVGALVFFSEKFSSKKKGAKKPKAAVQRPVQDRGVAAAPYAFSNEAAAKSRSEARQRRRHADMPPAAAPTKSEAQAPVELPEEGRRVTSDEPMRPVSSDDDERRMPGVPGGDLRSAIIWSEILKTKF